MSVETRIPIASKERWASLSTKEEKDKFVQQYNTWKRSPFTQELIKYYEVQLIKETEMHDKEQGFFSLFAFRFSEAVSRGKRIILRELLKQI
jgi:hypothetical protein